MGLLQQVRINTIYRILFLVFQLINTILISRLTGPAGFGVFSLVIVNANILLIFTSLGIPAGILFHASARDLALKKMEKIIWLSTLFQLALVIIFETIFYGLKGSFWIWPSSKTLAGAGGILFFLAIVLTEKYYALYNGFQHFYLYNLITVFFSVVLTALLVYLNFFPGGLPTHLVILSYVLVHIVQAFVLWLVFHRKKIGRITIAQGTGMAKKFFSYSFFAYLANALHFLVTRIDFWILHHYKGEEELGWYALAARIAQMFLVLPALLAGIIMPSVTSSELSGQSLEKIFRMVNSLNLLMIFVLTAFSSWLIPLLFGAEFSETVMPLLYLLPGIIFLSAQTLLASYFAGKGRPVINLYGSVIALVVVLALDLLLIPVWGAKGAAIASSIAYAAGCLYTYSRYVAAERYSWRDLFMNKSDREEVLTIINRARSGRRIP
jgi:O-antigen/teichoic acid export membrane protein